MEQRSKINIDWQSDSSSAPIVTSEFEESQSKPLQLMVNPIEKERERNAVESCSFIAAYWGIILMHIQPIIVRLLLSRVFAFWTL